MYFGILRFVSLFFRNFIPHNLPQKDKNLILIEYLCTHHEKLIFVCCVKVWKQYVLMLNLNTPEPLFGT